MAKGSRNRKRTARDSDSVKRVEEAIAAEQTLRNRYRGKVTSLQASIELKQDELKELKESRA